MTLPNKLTKYPEQAEFYGALREQAESHMDDFKKLYNNILTLDYSMRCLQLRMSTLIGNIKDNHMILLKDMEELPSEDAGPVNQEK